MAIFLGAVLIAAAGFMAVRINAGQAPKSIRIIYTNDLLGNLEPCG